MKVSWTNIKVTKKYTLHHDCLPRTAREGLSTMLVGHLWTRRQATSRLVKHETNVGPVTDYFRLPVTACMF